MDSNSVGSTTDTGLGMAIGLVQGMQANMDVLGSLVTGQDAQIQEISQSLKNIEADLKQLQNSKGQVDTDINTLRAQMREQIRICSKQLDNLASDYNNNVDLLSVIPVNPCSGIFECRSDDEWARM